jgi:hypothetical protein
MLSLPKWMSIRKKQITLYKLCKELHHTCSSDSSPASSRTSSTAQSNTYNLRHWSKARSPPVATPNELPPAHQAEALSALTEGLHHHLSFCFSDPEALDLHTRQQPPQ